jgi:hypothetical protein
MSIYINVHEFMCSYEAKMIIKTQTTYSNNSFNASELSFVQN